jgi:hypothetical protein
MPFILYRRYAVAMPRSVQQPDMHTVLKYVASGARNLRECIIYSRKFCLIAVARLKRRQC